MGGALVALFLLMSRSGRILLIVWIGIAVWITGICSCPLLTPSNKKAAGAAFSYDDYREFSLQKSLQIFKDHPYVGVGAGMYGGHISLRYESPIYAQYGFTENKYFDYLRDRVGSIEQQWLQVLAELGVVGMLMFAMLVVTPIFILRRLQKKGDGVFFNGLCRGLMIIPFQIGLYMVSFTVSQQQEWLILYFALLGMLVGAQREKSEHIAA